MYAQNVLNVEREIFEEALLVATESALLGKPVGKSPEGAGYAWLYGVGCTAIGYFEKYYVRLQCYGVTGSSKVTMWVMSYRVHAMDEHPLIPFYKKMKAMKELHNEGFRKWRVAELLSSNRHDVLDRPAYVFCESVHATGSSPWHIRRLGEKGLKPTGGIDTPSLCGRVKHPMGWDILTKINEDTVEHACRDCKGKYRGEGGE